MSDIAKRLHDLADAHDHDEDCAAWVSGASTDVVEERCNCSKVTLREAAARIEELGRRKDELFEGHEDDYRRIVALEEALRPAEDALGHALMHVSLHTECKCKTPLASQIVSARTLVIPLINKPFTASEGQK